MGRVLVVSPFYGQEDRPRDREALVGVLLQEEEDPGGQGPPTPSPPSAAQGSQWQTGQEGPSQLIPCANPPPPDPTPLRPLGQASSRRGAGPAGAGAPWTPGLIRDRWGR